MLWIILVMTAATFLTRFGSFALLRVTGIPKWFDRWLEQVPVGILTALVVPTLLIRQGHVDITPHNTYLLAGLATAAAAYFSENMVATIAVGMAVMLGLRMILA